MHVRIGMLTVATLALGITSCGHTASTAQPVAAPAAPREAAKPAPATAAEPVEKKPLIDPGPPPEGTPIGSVMAEHFVISSWARDVVISGQLDPLREPLELLAHYRYDGVKPGGWLPWVAQLQTAAHLTAEAETLDAAAMGVATMSRVCGECHRATGGGPKFAPEATQTFPAYRETFPDRMDRHMWAADQLWRGLTAPSDESWKAGAIALRDAPAQMDEWLPESFEADLAEVRRLGEQANVAAGLSERADVYGLLLSTCAGCHDRFIEHGL